MKIFVKVKTNSKNEKIQKLDDTHLNIWVKQPAKDNKANIAVIKAMSRYYNVNKTNISIIRGNKSNNKTIDIVI